MMSIISKSVNLWVEYRKKKRYTYIITLTKFQQMWNFMNKTRSYTYFTIMSSSKSANADLVSNNRGAFDPDDITEMLGILPFNKKKKGEISKVGSQECRYSIWEAEKSQIEDLDVEAQCFEIMGLKKCADPAKAQFFIVIGGVLCGLQLISMIVSMSAFGVIGFVLPILFIVGGMQNKKAAAAPAAQA
jgi:hypothetical protein